MKSRALKGVGFLAATLMGLGIAAPASASLNVFQTYVGQVGVSSDGWGSTTQSGTISASVPAGATVLAAYLYTSTFNFGAPFAPGGTFNGNAVNYSTNLGTVPPPACCSLTAYRADVTSIVSAVIDGGPGGVYNFSITETDQRQDGSALVVVYSHPSLGVSTIGILDGFARVEGDSASITFAQPLDPTDPDFFAEMRLGIGFSCCNTQRSTVTVNGLTMTENAGNNDDATEALSNGNLITVGGFDDPFSPANPSYAADHERYNLVSFINPGDTSINIRTINASRDDNVFLALFHVKGEAGISVPEPGSLALLGLGLVGLGLSRRRRSQALG